jgi:hypothetical protein
MLLLELSALHVTVFLKILLHMYIKCEEWELAFLKDVAEVINCSVAEGW